MYHDPQTKIWAGRVGGWNEKENDSYEVPQEVVGGVLRTIRFEGRMAEPEGFTQILTAGASPLDNAVSFDDGGSFDLTGAPILDMNVKAMLFVKNARLPSGLYVAVGGSGAASVATSPDGVTWTERINDYALSALTYAPALHRFLAVGNAGHLAWSDDGGETWSTGTIDGGTPTLAGVAWSASQGIFCAVNSAASTAYTGGIDPDPTNWSAAAMGGAGGCLAIAWSPSLDVFCAVGAAESYTSPDGVNWTLSGPTPISDAMSAIAWSPDLENFLAVSAISTQVMYSPDGLNWTSAGTFTGISNYGVTWAQHAGLWVAVGTVDTGTSLSILTSSDGVTWVQVAPESAGTFIAVTEAVFDRPYPTKVNVILTSNLRPAASQRFPVSLFSAGIRLNPSDPIVVDIGLDLNWELLPGDIVYISPEFGPSFGEVEFSADIFLGPGDD